ncbi:beta-fructofuranosidase, insoluble isoenzyme CWINV1-like protein [Tanacetum coccineum]
MYDPKMDLFVVVGDDFKVIYTRFQYDYGRFYASKSFYDTAKQRRVLWGWVNEGDSESDASKKSSPKSILLSDNKKQLVQWPVKEIEKLRRKGEAGKHRPANTSCNITSGFKFEA